MVLDYGSKRRGNKLLMRMHRLGAGLIIRSLSAFYTLNILNDFFPVLFFFSLVFVRGP